MSETLKAMRDLKNLINNRSFRSVMIPLQVLQGWSVGLLQWLQFSWFHTDCFQVISQFARLWDTANIFNDQIWQRSTHAPMCNHTRPGGRQDIDRSASSIISPIMLLAERTTITDHTFKMNPQTSISVNAPCSTRLTYTYQDGQRCDI